MSTSHPKHAIINAGSKAFGNDPIIGLINDPGFFWEGKPSYGSIQGRPDLWLGCLAGESSWVYYMDHNKKLSVGERLEIVPNNATLVINIHDQIYGVRNGKVEKVMKVNGRQLGLVQLQ